MKYIYTMIDHDYLLVKECYGVGAYLLNWLKDSCVKTKSGDDIVCYHGSPSKDDFAVFNDSSNYGCKSFVGFFLYHAISQSAILTMAATLDLEM